MSSILIWQKRAKYFTVAWVSFVFGLLAPLFISYSLDEIGDYLSGAFTPIAIIWLILGYFLQSEELKKTSKALKEQSIDINHSNTMARENAFLTFYDKKLDDLFAITTEIRLYLSRLLGVNLETLNHLNREMAFLALHRYLKDYHEEAIAAINNSSRQDSSKKFLECIDLYIKNYCDLAGRAARIDRENKKIHDNERLCPLCETSSAGKLGEYLIQNYHSLCTT